MSLISKIAEKLVKIKVKPILKRVSNSLSFPVKAKEIEKVLVILPRDMTRLDEANRFVQGLKKQYPSWKVELFDVDKLTPDQYTRMRIPKDEVTAKLKSGNYHFVIDLNEIPDQTASYLALCTEAPYRLHLNSGFNEYFNLTFQPAAIEDKQQRTSNGVYTMLLSYLDRLFV
jgi:hypothetical protein